LKLEIAEFPVKQIRLGHRFGYESPVLEVDEAALLALISEDARISDATLAVTSPGEKTRITGIRDVVEPRYKVSGSGQVFPGVLGAVETVGEGADASSIRYDRHCGCGLRRYDTGGNDGATKRDPRYVRAGRGHFSVQRLCASGLEFSNYSRSWRA
jgi:hypothetical protein